MVVTNVAKNKVRDLIANSIGNGAVGTGTTPPTVDDTDLQAKVDNTDKTLTVTTGEQTVNVKYVLTASDANGNDLTEFGIYFDSGEFLSRDVFPPFTKTDSVELHISHTINIL